MNFLKKLWQCLFVWKMPMLSRDELADVDAIVTQAISRSKNGEPGVGNEILAITVRHLHYQYPSKPIIPQEEVWLAINSQEATWTDEQRKTIPVFSVAHVPEGEPWDHSTPTWNTESVARFQAEICKKNGWKKVAVVATPAHHWRCMMVYKKLGLEPVIAQVNPCIGTYSHPEAAYWSARGGAWRQVAREFLCRLYFLFTGRL